MKNESIVKSIIYGNSITNSYGVFRALCAAITEKQHIDKIIFYLRAAENFRKYNKYVYAFRLEENQAVFITQNNNNKQEKNYIEGFNQDTTLEGNGQKLLFLLQKFNVRNVLVIVAISQKDPLHEFNSEHYMTVVKCAKDLLNSLYDRVIKSETEKPIEEYESKPIPRKLYILPELYKGSKFTREQRMKDLNRPNYVGLEFKKMQSLDRKELKRRYDLKYWNTKIKELAYALEKLIDQFTERENAIIKFAIQYDKSSINTKIVGAVLKLLGSNSRNDLIKDDMSQILKRITTKNISSQTIRELNFMILGDKELTFEKINQQNKVFGMIFEFLEILLKSYSFAKKIAMLQAENEKQDEKKKEMRGQVDRSMHSRRSQDINKLDYTLQYQ